MVTEGVLAIRQDPTAALEVAKRMSLNFYAVNQLRVQPQMNSSHVYIITEFPMHVAMYM